MNWGDQHLNESVPPLALELVPSVLHPVHGCLYPGDHRVCGFPGTKSPKYVWPELPGPGECSGRGFLDCMGLGSEKVEEHMDSGLPDSHSSFTVCGG